MPRTPRPLSLRLFRKGGWWQVDIRQNGRRWKESTNCERRSDAEGYVEQRRRELGGTPNDAAHQEAYAVADAVKDFRREPPTDVSAGTVKMLHSKAGHILRLLGNKDLTQLSLSDVTFFIEARRKEGAKEHTIAKELVTFRKLCGWCEARKLLAPGWLGWFPSGFRTGYVPRDRWLEPEEYLSLLATVPKRHQLWVQVGVYTGGRESELKALDWRDVDFRRGFVRLMTAKTRHRQDKRPRFIPMAAELRMVLEAARRLPDGTVKASGPVLVEPWKNPALMLTRYSRRAGICKSDETINDNDLRRTFASWMLQGGATVKAVADLLGHGSTAMVERVYGHLAKRNLREAVAGLPSFPT